MQYDEVADVALRAGEVRLKVEAIGINRAEVMFREGQYVENPVLPARLGYEAAGVIAEVGPGVTGWRVGDRAASIPGFSMNQYGSYGDLVTLPAAFMISTPRGFSSAEAAACWMQYFTAYMLIEFGGMKAGDQVLITAAASSVGLAAIQLARAVGARPIATTRKQEKAQALLDAGAGAVIDTKTTDLVAEVKRLTGGHGADVIFDPVVGPQLAALCDAAAEGGQCLCLWGVVAGACAVSVIQRVGEGFDVALLQDGFDRRKPGTARAREGVDPAAPGERRTQAENCADLWLPGNGRGASLHGVERADWQNYRDRPVRPTP